MCHCVRLCHCVSVGLDRQVQATPGRPAYLDDDCVRRQVDSPRQSGRAHQDLPAGAGGAGISDIDLLYSSLSGV